MKTSEAEKNGGYCPKCGDKMTQDPTGRGFVRHTTEKNCRYGNGERD